MRELEESAKWIEEVAYKVNHVMTSVTKQLKCFNSQISQKMSKLEQDIFTITVQPQNKISPPPPGLKVFWTNKDSSNRFKGKPY